MFKPIERPRLYANQLVRHWRDQTWSALKMVPALTMWYFEDRKRGMGIYSPQPTVGQKPSTGGSLTRSLTQYRQKRQSKERVEENTFRTKNRPRTTSQAAVDLASLISATAGASHGEHDTGGYTESNLPGRGPQG